MLQPAVSLEMKKDTVSSSTQIIESLYNKVDTLTNTNLQLTLQSQTMLENLDMAQKKEVKLIENISMYKYQRDNLDSMLNRKLRKIKEFEEEMASLQMTVNSIKSQNKDLSEELYNLQQLETLNREKMDQLDAQYDSLLREQQSCKLSFENDLSKINEDLQTIKLNYINKLNEEIKRSDSFEIKLNKFKRLIDKTEKLGGFKEISKDIIDNKCEQVLKDLDLDAWITLYKLCGRVVQLYATENGLDLSLLKNYDLTVDDPEINTIHKELSIDHVHNSINSPNNNTERIITMKRRIKSGKITSSPYIPSPTLGSYSSLLNESSSSPSSLSSKDKHSNSNDENSTSRSSNQIEDRSNSSDMSVLPGVKRTSRVFNNSDINTTPSPSLSSSNRFSRLF